MPYGQKGFGRTVHRRCLVSETHSFLNQLNCCEVMNADDDDDDDEEEEEEEEDEDVMMVKMM
jgi:hypothetical protein